MKQFLMMLVLLMSVFSMNGYAEEAVQDAKAAQFAKEIGQLKQDLAIKEAEYSEYIKSLDLRSAEGDVKLRGSYSSQCSYQCSLSHPDDMYMWRLCFIACND